MVIVAACVRNGVRHVPDVSSVSNAWTCLNYKICILGMFNLYVQIHTAAAAESAEV